MRTVLIHTLTESVHRRVALALIVVALLMLVTQVAFTHLSRDAATGELMVSRFNSSRSTTAKIHVTTELMPGQLQVFAQLWVLLTLFAAASLLTSYMEKGWVELLLSKGTPRWQIFSGRFLGVLALFVGSALIMNVGSTVYYALRAGVPLKAYFIALSFILLSFLSSLAILALVSTTQANTGLLVIVVFLEMIVTSVLSERAGLYRVITAKWVQWLLDWAYRILPKHNDLNRMASHYLTAGTMESWFPLWTTALFTVVATGWAFWRFERKAF